MMEIPIQLWQEIKWQILGTCVSPKSIISSFDLESFEITAEDLVEKLQEDSIEMCPECEWWVESYELVDDYDNLSSCENCKM